MIKKGAQHIFRAVSVAIVSALLTAGSGVAEERQIAAAGENNTGISDHVETVTLQLRWFHQFQFAGYYAAIEKGFYREAGIHVTLAEGGEGREPVDAVLNGRAEYGVTNSEILFHRLRGAPLVVLAAVFQHSPLVLMARRDSGIRTPHDLIGRKVRMSLESRDVELQAMLQSENISPDQMRLTDGWVKPEDYLSGVFDAISAYITNEPYLMIRQGIPISFIHPAGYGIDFYGDSLFTSEEELQKHPGRVKAFRAASLRGWKYAMNHPDELIDIILEKYHSKKSRDHLRYEMEKMRELILPALIQIGHINPARWEQMARTLVRLGKVAPGYDLGGFVYDPYGQSDPFPWEKLLTAVTAVALGAGIVAIILLMFNKKLSNLVRARTAELSAINKTLRREVADRELAEEEVRKLYGNLEIRIEENTQELREANQRLQQEVREREETGAALRKSETEKKAILDGIQTQLVFMGANRKILWVNKAVAAFSGRSPEELIGIRCHELWNASEKSCRDCPTSEVFHTGRGHQRIVHAKDGKIWDRRAEPVFDDQGKLIGVLEASDDVTEKVQAREQLQHTRKMEAISDLAAGIAHEFNNALFGITGNIELFRTRLGDAGDAETCFGPIQESARRMKYLTDRLLAYARGGKYQVRRIDPAALIRETLPLTRHNLTPEIRVDVALAEDISAIEADYTQMQMVFSEIISNAAEAVDGKGHIRITGRNYMHPGQCEANLAECMSGHYVCLSVEDDGRGMDKNTKDRIFDPFFTTNFLGRGLGMAAAYGIIRNHGGCLAVDSEPGEGTAVRIFLPAVDGIEEDMRIPGNPAFSEGEPNVLIIEDDEMVMDVTHAMIRRLGYQVLKAGSGAEALDIVRRFSGSIHMAILDICLPDMSGNEIYPFLIEARPEIRVIVCSGHPPDGAVRELLDAGADGFLQKPFRLDALSALLHRLLPTAAETSP
ncbi:hypothetical protein DENIS_2623 [Desulfonema ishimotonii]|uniref:histidine kinase n=1 Tax=Desulfonema ishimotonii TaxID=45657 RepID=A0A401FXH4_9BACT|nr:ABC transporter substrate-binding protein [Desulfonema ishimotonii]GBC61661.1 hypothetical protein DENIS_2623 [Desulfonema ishimotonii]